jgi:hypothetical protein
MNTVVKITIFFCACFFACKNADSTLPLLARSELSDADAVDFKAVKTKANEAKIYCKSKKLNTDFFLLADLKRHSGLKRFYIWDFKKDTISNAFLVSHGCGENPWAMDYSKEIAKVSNADGSHLSSVGKYIIGSRGYSNWGINVNYLMLGQDATNSNAVKRQIVLHSWEKVPDEEIYPNGTPEGWGCPALSNAGMRIVDAKLKISDKKVLLWVVQ